MSDDDLFELHAMIPMRRITTATATLLDPPCWCGAGPISAPPKSLPDPPRVSLDVQQAVADLIGYVTRISDRPVMVPWAGRLLEEVEFRAAVEAACPSVWRIQDYEVSSAESDDSSSSSTSKLRGCWFSCCSGSSSSSPSPRRRRMTAGWRIFVL